MPCQISKDIASFSKILLIPNENYKKTNTMNQNRFILCNVHFVDGGCFPRLSSLSSFVAIPLLFVAIPLLFIRMTIVVMTCSLRRKTSLAENLTVEGIHLAGKAAAALHSTCHCMSYYSTELLCANRKYREAA